MAKMIRQVRTGSAALALLAGALLSAALVSVAAPGAALAQDDENTEKAKERFAEGRAAYDKGDYATAVARWEEAQALRPNNKLLIYIARAYDQQGKPGKALEYLQRYASIGPDEASYVKEELAQIRKAAVRATMRVAWKEVDDALAVATPGKRVAKPREEKIEIEKTFVEVPFAVTTEPPGATVYVDSKEWGSVGTTPVNIKIFSGRHTIFVERPYYEPQQVELYVRPIAQGAQPQKAAFALQRQQVPVDLTTIPDNAEITLIKDSGETLKLGKGKFKGNLPAGETKFILNAAGMGQREFTRTILPSEISQSGFQLVEFDMRSSAEIAREGLTKLGTLQVEGYLIGADVLVNGKKVGQTPRLSLELAPGPHTLEIVKEGFEPWTQIVRIEAGKPLTVQTPETLTPLAGGVNWGGWLTLTAGVAIAGGGGFFTLQQMSAQEDVDALVRPGPDDQSSEAQAQRKKILDLEEEVDQNALFSYILYGAGGAAVVTGVILLAVGGDDEIKVVTREGDLHLAISPLVVGAPGVGVTLTWP